ncbi:hypothetical protein [Clostridium folliculivorans]|uniref:Uncharacterized protein n=1 Tax=Clostridium folliculivorans TaxID=2886038 RepID=A0A9W5Y245_9CLOT|nr:hypothetical protein [Clostridium folliculivorans]GKU25195.1 hypothetical protein CFOLD11_20210 [Clostridium folliculivorans]GKU31293.1 hypothetical protein CFB3_34000 [Clostridium folliculivorans]
MEYNTDDLTEIIKIFSAIKKDSVREKIIENIKAANMELLKVEADSRRSKSTEIIKQMFRLDMAIKEFEINYTLLKSTSDIDNIKAIDDYIASIKKRRRDLSSEKRRL